MRTLGRYFKFILASLLVFIVTDRVSNAQCASLSFESPATSCLNESIEINNTSTATELDYSWDFCEGDLSYNPVAETVRQILDAPGPTGLNIVKEDNNFFMFIAGRTGNNLVRLELGDSPRNSNPNVVNLGNPQNSLKGPVGIQLLKEAGAWYAIVYNSQTDSLVRFSFGASLTNNSPVAENVAKAYGSSNSNSGLAVGVSSEKVVVAVTSPATSKITLIDFGNSITNTPVEPSNILTTTALPGASSLRGITLLHMCSQWYGFAVASSSRKIYRLEFGTNLFSVPAVFDITGSFSGTDNFQDIRAFHDAGSFVGFVLTSQGVLYKLDFGSDITSIPDKINLGNLGLMASTLRFDFIKDNSEWSFFTANTGTRYFYRGDFPNTCSALFQAKTGFQPGETAYSSAGLYHSTLQAYDPLAGYTYLTQEITVEDKPSPQIDITHAEMCVGVDIHFSVASDLQLVSANWNFNDGGTSEVMNPVHVFAAAGDYTVKLSVTAENGCSNKFSRQVAIYDPPVSDFTMPASVLCTNNEFVFPSTTPDSYNGNLVYQWYVDGSPVSNGRDLHYTFTTTGVKAIKLYTSIPGCSSEITKSTSPVASGPAVEFTVVGTCQGETFSFINTISETVESLHWDFGNGQTSTAPNPSTNFAEFGDYDVSLTATNAAGCENIKTKPVSVHAKPLVDFSAEGPPNSCTGSPVSFQNQTLNPDGRAITAWLWDFGDPNNTVPADDADPQHVFADAGTYRVALTASTQAGCSAIAEQDLQIDAAPSTDFIHTAACDDLPVMFSGPDGPDIAGWYWEIGTSYYEVASPTHTFKAPGDYPVSLEVSAANGCVASAVSSIRVPAPLVPDFSYIKNCVGQPAVFTDITAGDDPVVSRQWYAGSEEMGTATVLTHTFTEQRKETIRLKVTSAAGCGYETSKEVTVVPAPVAAFVADPPSGAWPLEVSFTNSSVMATHYQWEFMDGTGAVSHETSPAYTFPGPGSFDVKLTAFNDQQCEDGIVQNITTADPFPDADIEMVTLAPNDDGTIKLIVTIHNKGNTVLRGLPLLIDFSGTFALQASIRESIRPASKYNFVFNAGIVGAENLRFLCVSIEVENDINPAGNRLCREFENQLFTFPPYPNPATAILNVAWISAAGKTVHLVLTDALGRTVWSQAVRAATAFSQETVDLRGLLDGLYFLIIEDGSTRSVCRVVISSRP